MQSRLRHTSRMNIIANSSQNALTQLRAVLPEDCLITDADGLNPYETDGLTAIREEPWLVVLPTTEQQVVEVVNICRRNAIPVIPRGAGTGLSGGARRNVSVFVLYASS